MELFDDIYEKVYSAEQQSQKEKYEVELKKEIKKLQRLRDQIKSWISGSEVKDKDQLLEYRRLIETKMEAFKVVEKETKTKTFSKEGLARKEKLDPEEQKKADTNKWIGEVIDQLNGLIDDQDLEVEQLSSGRGKKTNKNKIEECNQHLASHRFHLSKLEGIMRLVRNDRISADKVDQVKEDLEYYVESHEEDDFMMAYDEECFYDELGLDDLDVVNVDRITQVSTATKMDDSISASSGSKKEKHSKKAAATRMIPLTIGRAQKSAKAGSEKGTSSNEATPTKLGRANSSASSSSGPTPVVAPAPTPKAPAAPGGATSMAAMLKRESEERLKAQAAAAAQQAELARQQQQAAELLRQQQLQKQQAEAQRLQQEAALRQQQLQAQQKAVAQAESLKRQQAQALLEQQQRQQQAQQQQQDAVAKQQMLQQQQAAQAAQASQQNVLNVGLSGLSLGNAVVPNAPTPSSASVGGAPQQQPSSVGAGVPSSTPSKDATERYLSALNDSMLQMPTSTETTRASSYTPRNPYPAAPPCYPSTPSPIFDNPAVFEKLGTDALFFIFYYAQGTYQQYLAARELKKQSWRYHKKYMTWFQRHEEPKVTTDDYEQGTYVYFDYETGWCQRIKSDFRFEYSFLEDSLSV